MVERIPSESACVQCCRITLLERSIGVCPLVRDEREQEDGNRLDDLYELAVIQVDAEGSGVGGRGASARKVVEA